ncbi:MAG: hypothetical protein RLZZ292_2172 [Bacteroidota bacterium]|jgi:hypothetical protein
MKKNIFSLLLLAVCFSLTAQNQADSLRVSNALIAVSLPAALDHLELKEGTTIFLTLDEVLEVATLTPGNSLDFVVRSAVVEKGVTLIEKGAIAEGTILRLEQDLEGHITAAVLAVTSVQAADSKVIDVLGRKETVRFVYDAEGKTHPIPKGVNLSAVVLKSVEMFFKAPKAIEKEVAATLLSPLPAKEELSGDSIRLSTTTSYQASDFFVGKAIPLRCTQTIKTELGEKIIEFGAVGLAEVREVNKGAFGTEITLQLKSVRATDGQQIALHGNLILAEKDFLLLQELSGVTAKAIRFLWKQLRGKL